MAKLEPTPSSILDSGIAVAENKRIYDVWKANQQAGQDLPRSPEQQRAINIRAAVDNHPEVPFVQRIQNPGIFPVLNNPDGSIGTHEMRAEQRDNGEWISFPQITPDYKGGMVRIPGAHAMNTATADGNYLNFGDNKQRALNFSKHYKDVLWPNGFLGK